MTRIAVTGASGFVGRELIPLLLEEGHEVVGLARSSPDRTGGARTLPGFTFIPGDVRDPGPVKRLLDGVTHVAHMAASFDPLDDSAAINVEGTRVVVEAAKAAGVERLVYLSCLGAQASSASPFLTSKWRAEQLVRAGEVPFSILLPSLVLGRDDGVVRPLAMLIRRLPVVPVPGSGDARTQPIDVHDLCRCIVAALFTDAVKDEMVSVGGPSFLTGRELVDLVAGAIGASRPKVFVPPGWQGRMQRLLPREGRGLFAPARTAILAQGVVASPGIVPRTFGFEPADITLGLPGYLA